MRVPLLAKMLTVLLLATLGPLSIFGALSIRRGLDAVGRTAEQNLQLVASVAAARIDQLFADMRQLQVTAATADIVEQTCSAPADQRQDLLPRTEQWLNEVLSRNPDIALAYIADAKGICLLSTSSDMVGLDYSATREYMRRALRGEDAISDLAVGITTREPGVFFAGPIRRLDNTLAGVLVFKLKGQVIDQMCREVTAQTAQGFAIVIDANEVIIFHPNSKLLYRSIGSLSPEAMAQIKPKLQYGIDQVQSAGADDIAKALRQGRKRGCLIGVGVDGLPQIAGYARMTQRPWTVTVAQPRAVFDQSISHLAQEQKWWIVGIGIAAALGATGITYSLLRPIKSLRVAALKAAEGDWSARANVHGNDELTDLAHTFNEMMPALQERARMQDALRLANEVQQRLLPQANPLIPGLDVAGASLPAEQTGGDYYDFLDLSHWQPSTLAIAIGDVTGHGVGAALLMTTARALLRSQAIPPRVLAEVLEHMNRHLAADSPDGRFMTLLYAVLDRPKRSLRLVSAGHDPVIVYDPQADRFQELSGNDIPLGVDPNWRFSEASYDLPPNAILLFGTDGIWEAFDSAHNPFGKERLKECLLANRNKSAQEISDAIQRAVADFRGSVPQLDDITLVVIRLLPVPSEATAPHDAIGGDGLRRIMTTRSPEH
ncbi:MAG: SpoIIE family protein phosphatase [Bacillota bacterium]